MAASNSRAVPSLETMRSEAHDSEQDAQAEKIIAQHSKLTVKLAAIKKEAAALRSQLPQRESAARKRPRRGEGSSSASGTFGP